MRCCVPFCKNTEENTSKSEWISFHEFPTEPHMRTAWLRALGKQDCRLPDSAVVCSQHFLNSDIYETRNGLSGNHTDAVPSTVYVCMICLDTNNKQILLSKYKMQTAYENLTGYSLCEIGNLTQTLCIECAQRLTNFSKFRDKSLRAHSLMMDLVTKHDFITLQHIKSINHLKDQLKTMFDMDNCDLYIFEKPDEDKEVDIDNTEQRERNDQSSIMIDKDHTEAKSEIIAIKNEDVDDNDFVVSNNEYISEESTMVHTKLLNDEVSEALLTKFSTFEANRETEEQIKYKNIFRCTFCYGLFLDENTYNEHMVVHHEQHDQCDFDLQETKLNDPLSLATNSPEPRSRSNSYDSSHITDNYRVQTPSDDSPADNVDTLVAPTLASHINNIKLLHQVKEADEIEDSKQVFEIDNDESRTKKSIISCKSNSLNSVNINQGFSYQRTNQNGAFPIKTNEIVTKQLIVKLDKLNLPKIQQSNLSYEVNKVRKRSRIDKNIPTKCICDICQKVFKQKKYLIHHIKTVAHTKRGEFICEICGYRCERYSTLVRHRFTHTAKGTAKGTAKSNAKSHTDAKLFYCNFCKYSSTQKCFLVNHIRIHSGEKPFSCKLCDFKSAHSSCLTKHMRTHFGIKPYSCSLCEYSCTQKNYLNNHMRTHTDPFSCNLCEFNCAQKKDLVQHMKTHSGPKPFSCELCKYKCSLSGDLVRHMRIHTGEKPFSCKLCDYKFAYNGTLTRHMFTHTGVKPFSCNLCKFNCAQKSSLVRHMLTHTKSFSCNVCGFTCALKKSLAIHMRTHTYSKPLSSKLRKCAQKSSLPRPVKTCTEGNFFSCTLCKYKCVRNCDLIRHMSSHSGLLVTSKPFACDICEYKCAQKGTLVVHMRTHAKKLLACNLCEYTCTQERFLLRHMKGHNSAGNNHYTCKLCKGIFRRGSLTSHMRIHNGVKPFACKLCNYRSRQNGGLISHMRTHTADPKLYSCDSCEFHSKYKTSLIKHIRTRHSEAKESKLTLIF